MINILTPMYTIYRKFLFKNYQKKYILFLQRQRKAQLSCNSLPFSPVMGWQAHARIFCAAMLLKFS